MRKKNIGRSVTSSLYKYARLSNDLTTLLSGDPKKILRRVKNKLLGRFIIKKFW